MSAQRILASVWLFALALCAHGPDALAADDCPQGRAVRLWTAPLGPRPGSPLEIVAVATDGPLEQILITDPNGRRDRLRVKSLGGPPWALYGTQFRPVAGTYRTETSRFGRIEACTRVTVGEQDVRRETADWNLETEALYSVWIEHLFDTPPHEPLSFDSLGPVLRDPERNFLFNYLGQGEDRSIRAEPDCADLPYFLRSYFAWKLGLPVAYRACSRGSSKRPPSCRSPMVETRFMGAPVSLDTFREIVRRQADTVHSGSARTALSDESTDFYPVPLERDALWPGTLYADPYGHVMVLVKWVPQRGDRSGLLLAVDAQPDNSVTRKRFWEGTFLFAKTHSAGPGFKTFRPLTGSGSGLRPVSNTSLDGRDGLPRYSTEQASLTPDDFYARLETLINPRGLDPNAAYEATLDALMEQLETRVASVANGEDYVRSHPGTTIAMPSGPAIFETTGAWEDYSTPSRDMRLLIAMKVLESLPERIRRYPNLYRLAGESPSAAASRIERLHARRLEERSISYRRSDGSDWRLSLGDIYRRRPGLEVGYNPNDCIERRWGATEDSPDGATCGRRAPRDQLARMESYRPWFRDTVRPPR
ncbi:hypothetical protein [Imhoffiella purpurea]|uniref:hypothetical protein n=1 Tax=Imhoffiella purpurea TaxID=1249627 RepID=UPI0005C12996|nr:hypothetical protein [Imhoffiella purpurea]